MGPRLFRLKSRIVVVSFAMLALLKWTAGRKKTGRKSVTRGRWVRCAMAAAWVAVLAVGLDGARAATLDRELYLFNWDRYVDPQILKDFETEFGVRVIEDHYASNEDLLAKLQAGGAGYDVAVPSDYMVRIMIRQGLLARLDHSNLPNLRNLGSRFRAPAYDPRLEFSVPYLWGTSGIGYLGKRVQPAPTSWADLFDPERLKAHKGRVSMLNDMREAIGAALIYKGFSPNTRDPAQLAAARDVLLRQKPLLAKYDSENYEDSLVAGETVLAHGWSGEIFTAQKDNPDILFALPREGTFLFVDNLVIPARSKRKRTAEVFINYLMRPEIAARNSVTLRYPTPNESARRMIDPKLPGASYALPSGIRLYSIEDLGEAGRQYERIWTELKAR
jgi:spermidine/putrescine-binding protein